ncbi:MAG: hypothetical protein ACJZ6A_00045 [Candidatus Poseidoniaceae archaeon]|tara:strand:+ start:188 stop:1486 length:1299 start_codon:yes stop_codon:yes gene_type:complete
MQECRVCGLLFLGGGACPSCGSQVALDLQTNDIVMDDESIPGLDDVAEAIGSQSEDEDESEILPFGMGAKAEILESSLPFGVGSFTDEIEEVAIPISDEDYDVEVDDEIDIVEDDVPDVVDEEIKELSLPEIVMEESIEDVEIPSTIEEEILPEPVIEKEVVRLVAKEELTPVETSQTIEEEDEKIVYVESSPDVLPEDVPDMWRIDAAAVDMDEIYSQDEQIIEVSFDDDLEDSDVLVSFDEFHHSPIEDSMISDDDAPELHPARALAVDASGQPEIAQMIENSFEYMANSSWMEAAQILSTVSTNRQNDSAVLNNLGLALLQSALEMDSKGDPMSSSQYEASIMALRQGAKLDSENNILLLNLSHALLVSGRAEKALGVIGVLRGRESSNVEVENVYGACLIQLGRDDEAQSVLAPFAGDAIVSGNLALI